VGGVRAGGKKSETSKKRQEIGFRGEEEEKKPMSQECRPFGPGKVNVRTG